MRFCVAVFACIICVLLWAGSSEGKSKKHKKRTADAGEENQKTFPEVNFTEVQDILKANGTKGVVIDVREVPEIKRDGRVPGFHNIPLMEVADAFQKEPDDFLATYNFTMPEKSDTIVFSCRSGRRALLGAQKLDALGGYNQ